MRSVSFLALVLSALSARADVYMIGNSMTNDTLPWLFDDVAGWHIDCGRSLPYIYANPDMPCVIDSTLWPSVMPFVSFDQVTVQPNGGTVAENVDVISQWMTMQPGAAFVIHTSWPGHAVFNDQAATYRAEADAIVSGLQAAFPGRTVYRDHAIDALMKINSDIANGAGPFDQLSDVYRDAIHMTSGGTNDGAGVFLMHNVLRTALGQPLNLAIYPSLDPTIRQYMLDTIAAVPEAPQVAMLAVPALTGCALAVRCWRNKLHLRPAC